MLTANREPPLLEFRLFRRDLYCIDARLRAGIVEHEGITNEVDLRLVSRPPVSLSRHGG